MKEFMQIIGANILDNNWIEVTLQSLTLVKKKKIGLMELATGDLQGVAAALAEDKVYHSKVSLKLETWHDMKLKIGSHVSLELLPDKTTGGIE